MDYDPNNIFAKILRGDVSCERVYEDSFCLAFHDISPQAPIHVLVIPKGEFTCFDDFTTNASPSLLMGFFQSMGHVIQHLGVHKKGYRIIMNKGANGGQEVDHFHVHILAGKPLGVMISNE